MTRRSRFYSLVAPLWTVGFALACSSSDGGGTAGAGGSSGTSTGGSSTGGSSTGGSSTGGSSTGGSSTGGSSTGGSSTGGSSTGGASTGGSSTGGSSTGGTGTTDPIEAARQKCIDYTNQLRATKGRAPYTRWTSIEACVDGEATYDSTHGPHASFIGGNTCGAWGQGECPGSGPSNVTGCIDLMWAEKDQAICSGCDSCPSLNACFGGSCPNCQCTTSNPTCGHYVALVTAGFSNMACGFSTAGAYTAFDYQ